MMPGSIGLSPLYTGHANDLHISTANGPPRGFRHASTCPRIDRPASGRIIVTLGTCIPRAMPDKGYALVAFALTPAFQALVSPPRYTPWPVLQNV